MLRLVHTQLFFQLLFALVQCSEAQLPDIKHRRHLTRNANFSIDSLSRLRAAFLIMKRRLQGLSPIALLLLLTIGITAVEPPEPIIAAAKEYIAQHSDVSDVEITVEKVQADYARVLAKPRDATRADPAWVFLKRENGSWRGVAIGTDFSEDDLKKLGIPISLQP